MQNIEMLMRRFLTRRTAIAALAAGGAFTAAAFARRSHAHKAVAPPGCVITPEQTEGPFFVEEPLDRAEIRSDPATGAMKAGAPLRLTFKVSHVDGKSCAPLAGAQVHLWQCDAAGVYSDVPDSHGSTLGQKFLRGYQTTGANGIATFTTIYPGWYEGRTVHIHFKVRTPEQTKRGREFTSQIYFDDALSDKVFTRAPYAGRGRRDMRNEDDSLFRRGGKRLIIALAQQGEGYAGTFDVGLKES